MSGYSTFDLSQTPPLVTVPRDYNVAVDFMDRRVEEGFGDKIAFIDDNGGHMHYVETVVDDALAFLRTEMDRLGVP